MLIGKFRFLLHLNHLYSLGVFDLSILKYKRHGFLMFSFK